MANRGLNYDDFGILSDPNNDALTMASADPTLKGGIGFGPYEHIREGGDNPLATTPVAPPSSFPDTSDVPFYRETGGTTLDRNDTASINRQERGRLQLRNANKAILAPIDAAKNAKFPKLATEEATNDAYNRYGKGRVEEARAAMASERASMAKYGEPMIKAKATGGDIARSMEAHQDSLDAAKAAKMAIPAKTKPRGGR